MKYPKLIQFYQSGQFFGYPQCCIDEFVERVAKIQLEGTSANTDLSKERLEASDFTGFIPCQKHAEQIVAKEITLESLISNRICTVDFSNFVRISKEYNQIDATIEKDFDKFLLSIKN